MWTKKRQTLRHEARTGQAMVTMNDSLRSAVCEAVHRAQMGIRWKPGKDVAHLAKRIRLGHLPVDATLDEYEAIIAAVMNSPSSELYLFTYEKAFYPTLVAAIENRIWLVMVRLDGVLETAFPPDDPESYLADPSFVHLGSFAEFAK